MRALFYLEDKLVAEEFYKCQQWKGENGNYLVIDTERGQRLFFDFSKNTNPNIGTAHFHKIFLRNYNQLLISYL